VQTECSKGRTGSVFSFFRETSAEALPFIAVAGVAVVTALFSAAAAALEEDEATSCTHRAIAVASDVIGRTLVEGRSKRQKIAEVTTDEADVVKRRFFYDYERARACIQQDYLGEHPTFGPDDFKRMFRVSRATYDSIRSYLSGVQSFFRDGKQVTNRMKISADGKVMMALKYLAYGCSVNAFRDYFQIGESTAMKCVKLFIKEMSKSPFRHRYLGSMTPADAKKMEALHRQVHGIAGMIGSLDCSHFVWKNCPTAHQGQFQGKEGRPTVVVEAMADYNLYCWHAIFGYAGTLNDITIWDNSFLLKAICDGSFEQMDFPFIIGGEHFDKLWMLVDGIYPPLSRFVKPLSVPIGDTEALFSLWQESKRKDIERFFAVFKGKFGFFTSAIPFAFIEDIIEAFYACLILHNMAVIERVASGDGTTETAAMYDVVGPAAADEAVQPEVTTRENLALQFVQLQENDVNERTLEVEFLSALGIHVVDARLPLDLERIQVLPQYQRVALQRWNQLYDSREHNRLTQAIARELKQQYDDYKKSKKN